MTTPTSPLGAPPASRLGRTEVLRREWYLLRLSWYLQDYPGREEKRIRRDLRAELTLAAADVGMTRALRDLGHPLVLAEGYKAELGRRLPRWTAGAMSAALAIVLVVYLGGAYAAGTLDALQAMGGGTLTTYPLGAPTTFTATEDELSLQSVVTAPGLVLLLVVAAVAFVLGARIWRVLG